MSKIVKSVEGCETTLKPITGNGTNPYGFALIYPETVDYIHSDSWYYFGSGGFLDFGDDLYHIVKVFESLEFYIKLCSMISRSRPMPTISINSKDDCAIKHLEWLGLIEPSINAEDGTSTFVIYRKEPNNE